MLKLSVATKIIGFTTILLLVSIASQVWVSARLFVDDNSALIQQINADTAQHLAKQLRGRLEDASERMRLVGKVLLEPGRDSSEFFTKDPDFLGVALWDHRLPSPPKWAGRESNPPAEIQNMLKGLKISVGVPELLRVESAKGVLMLSIPFLQVPNSNETSHSILGFFREERFSQVFEKADVVTGYLVTNQGRLLSHPDQELLSRTTELKSHSLVDQMKSGKFDNSQTRFVDPLDGIPKLGAFRNVGFANLAVMAEVPEEKAFEAARHVVYRATLVAVIILCLAVLGAYFVGETLAHPIRILVDATRSVAKGRLDVHVTPISKDEVGELSQAFNEMTKGLEERDRVKNAFTKFHSKEIAEKILSGQIRLGGERREAVIFFSDVRGFVSMTDHMPPEAIVEMLNEYMTRMVTIIQKHGGVVDKYVGDAIMALWGVPVSSPDDTENALKACLEMRMELAALNQLRLSRGESPIRIGMGLHRGEVIAGNIGSESKMEYTVIGDAVNLASRIESMTKDFGRDLLISHSVYENAKLQFLMESCGSVPVKGKKEPIQLYRVDGYWDEEGSPMVVKTAYSQFEIPKKSQAA
jgi:adenylate cyclase